MTWKRTPTDAYRLYRKRWDKQLRLSAIRILRCVVRISAVDSGRFRGNWQLSHGFPKLSYNESMKDKGGSTTINNGKAAAQSIRKPNRFFITNNVPYAAVLNYGRPPGNQWSPQMPLYSMETCVLKERNRINRKKVGDLTI